MDGNGPGLRQGTHSMDGLGRDTVFRSLLVYHGQILKVYLLLKNYIVSYDSEFFNVIFEIYFLLYLHVCFSCMYVCVPHV